MKKILSLILCLFMVLSGMTLPSMAEGQGISVIMTLGIEGDLVEGSVLVPVTLSGKEEYNLDDVFSAFHKLYYDGEDGYASSDDGTYVTKFWGDESGFFGYHINGDMAGGLGTIVRNGDFVEFSIYENRYPDTEAYTKFDVFETEGYVDEDICLTMYQEGYEEVDDGLSGFEPDEKMTRAMLVTVLYRMTDSEKYEAENSFEDVPEGEWYTDAVMWAKMCGVTEGVSETEFAPDENLTREQMALIVYRFAQISGYDVSDAADISGFLDTEDVSDFAVDAVKWANKTEPIRGTGDNMLSPKETATRAEVATILMRFCNLLK